MIFRLKQDGGELQIPAKEFQPSSLGSREPRKFPRREVRRLRQYSKGSTLEFHGNWR